MIWKKPGEGQGGLVDAVPVAASEVKNNVKRQIFS